MTLSVIFNFLIYAYLANDVVGMLLTVNISARVNPCMLPVRVGLSKARAILRVGVAGVQCAQL
jgi:hypothetical protein